MLNKIKRFIKNITNSDYRFLMVTNLTTKYDSWPDDKYLQRKYKAITGKGLSLHNPITFNEKIQWLKLYDRNEIYTTMVDKHLVKEYVACKIGYKYIIPTIAVWNSPHEVDFSILPERFVIKCNHNSGKGMYICKDKTFIDSKQIIADLKKGFDENYFLHGREWPYKNVKRKIIAETFLEDSISGLTDYKVHVFNGVPKFILVCRDRFSESGLTEDFFTPEWEHISVKRPNIPNSSIDIVKPEQLDEILDLSKKLAKDIPFVRVDFYIVKNQVYFSELTFYPASGFSSFEPEEWDYTFGSWLKLPNKEQHRS